MPAFEVALQDIQRVQEYIRRRVVIDDNGCWIWQKSLYPTGYGMGCYWGKSVRAHRLAVAAFKEGIPDGMSVCHACDVRRCCNPDHLWIGTHSENLKDAVNKGFTPKNPNTGKTHCPAGHEYTPENTIVFRGGRQCRTCHNLTCKARYQRKQQAAGRPSRAEWLANPRAYIAAREGSSPSTPQGDAVPAMTDRSEEEE